MLVELAVGAVLPPATVKFVVVLLAETTCISWRAPVKGEPAFVVSVCAIGPKISGGYKKGVFVASANCTINKFEFAFVEVPVFNNTSKSV